MTSSRSKVVPSLKKQELLYVKEKGYNDHKSYSLSEISNEEETYNSFNEVNKVVNEEIVKLHISMGKCLSRKINDNQSQLTIGSYDTSNSILEYTVSKIRKIEDSNDNDEEAISLIRSLSELSSKFILLSSSTVVSEGLIGIYNMALGNLFRNNKININHRKKYKRRYGRKRKNRYRRKRNRYQSSSNSDNYDSSKRHHNHEDSCKESCDIVRYKQ